MSEPAHGPRYSDLLRERDDLAAELHRVNALCNGLRGELDAARAEIDRLEKLYVVRSGELELQRENLRAALAAAVEVLRDTSNQLLPVEMESDQYNHADFEGAYEIIVSKARAFLARMTKAKELKNG